MEIPILMENNNQFRKTLFQILVSIVTSERVMLHFDHFNGKFREMQL